MDSPPLPSWINNLQVYVSIGCVCLSSSSEFTLTSRMSPSCFMGTKRGRWVLYFQNKSVQVCGPPNEGSGFQDTFIITTSLNCFTSFVFSGLYFFYIYIIHAINLNIFIFHIGSKCSQTITENWLWTFQSENINYLIFCTSSKILNFLSDVSLTQT